MYSQKIITANIDALVQKRVRESHPKPELVRYSIAETNRALEHFTSIAEFDKDGEWLGKWKRPLEQDEAWFIENESLMCNLDFLYAATHYAKIMTVQKISQLFRPNLAQVIKLAIYGELEELGQALIIQALKARQLGSSTLDELIVWHRATFHPHTNAIVGSSDPEKSAKMFQMVSRAWRSTPFYLQPELTKYSTGQYYEFENFDSFVSIQHGTQFSGIGRGDTPNVAHLSELVDFDDPRQLVDASLLRALHETPKTFLSLESTANGRGDWWHDNWVANRENTARGMSKMYPVFLPWFVGRDIYPTETWLKARPIPSDWHPNDNTIQHARRAADYVKKTPLLAKHLGHDWELPIEQMWWYEVEKKWAIQKNELNVFLSECPANDDEAFQSRSGSIFPVEIISDRRECTTLPKWAINISGGGIPERLVTPASHMLDSSIPFTNALGRFVRVDDRFTPYEKLCLWEMPTQGEEYEIAIDTGFGIGEDRTVIQIGRRGTPEKADAQVGEWASPNAGAIDIAPIVYAIGELFTTRAWDGRTVYPRITIEMAAGGEALQAELRKMGWRHFYVRNRLGSALRSESIINPMLGWATTAASRPKIIDHLLKVVRDELVLIRSPWLVDELADLQRSEKNYKIEAAPNTHDDRLMAFAIMSYVMYDLDSRGEPSRIYRAKREAESELAIVPQWKASKQLLPDSFEDDGTLTMEY